MINMNIQYIDILPVFRAYKNHDKLYWEADLHLSTDGHSVSGLALAKELLLNWREKQENRALVLGQPRESYNTK